MSTQDYSASKGEHRRTAQVKQPRSNQRLDAVIVSRNLVFHIKVLMFGMNWMKGCGADKEHPGP